MCVCRCSAQTWLMLHTLAVCHVLKNDIVYRKVKQAKPRPMTGKVVLNKDGSIKSKTENIPSELQKTISDAIRKARNKEGPSSISSNQGYAGAGQAGKI